MNLQDIDPATLQASPEADAMVAEKRMGWETRIRRGQCEVVRPETCHWSQWSPSTNSARAIEAMLEAENWSLQTIYGLAERKPVGITCLVRCGNVCGVGRVRYTEIKNNVGGALALAITRAIVSAMQAAEAAGGK